jgi:cellulose 1,4-beta-cellobiosidase
LGSASVVSQFQEDKLMQFFVQDGQRIDVPGPTFDGLPEGSDLTPEFCTNVFTVFDDFNRFDEVGGFPALNDALNVPMVLVMSIWDDVSFLLQFECATAW